MTLTKLKVCPGGWTGRGPTAILLAGNLLLSIGLTAAGLRRSPVVVVPGVREHQVVLPDEVPDQAVRRFALLYLSFFDNYTPETVEDRSNFLLRFVAAEHLESVVKMLSERAEFVLRAKESAQLVLPPPTRGEALEVSHPAGGVFRMTTVGERRIYIASELKTTEKVRYVIDLKPSLPTDEDPYGFAVVGLSARPEPHKEPYEHP